MREAALELGAKRLVVGECGHAWRVAYSFWNTLDRRRSTSSIRRYPAPQHICELTYDLVTARRDPPRREKPTTSAS